MEKTENEEIGFTGTGLLLPFTFILVVYSLFFLYWLYTLLFCLLSLVYFISLKPQ
ncbi:hypothetical protein BC941DRAFT_420361 [Chlamydoabsidia padenii]|nr:hypothetical protein BC941DRAFT_420361 [Chlamydoabsidia padenii]